MPRRSRYKSASRQLDSSILYPLLAQEIIKSSDFQSLFDQLANKLRSELLQQLVQQPLRQFGTAIGSELASGLSGDASSSFALSNSQLGATLHELLADAEAIL